MSNGLTKLCILGRHVGAFETFDVSDDLVHVYYGFQPIEGDHGLLSGDVTVNYEAGTMSTFDGDQLVDHVDLVPILAQLPQEKRHEDTEGDAEAIDPEEDAETDAPDEVVPGETDTKA